MLVRAVLISACLSCVVGAQEDTGPAIARFTSEGDGLYLKGDYEGARQVFISAWALAEQTPKDNPARYDILKRLTSVRSAAGEFADADNWLQQAITWRENNLGWKDHKIADDLLISVSLCRGMKDFDRGLAILRRVQTLHIEAYTLNSTPVADDFSRMGGVYADKKELENAVNAIDAALAIRSKLGGPLDPALIGDLDRLGEYHTTLRAYGRAEEAFRHALVIRETMYGKTHADLIGTVDGLAYALFGQKKYEEAEPVYQRLMGLWESSVGKDHAMVAVALDKLAIFYSAQKKHAETREALERATAIRARFLALGLSQQATEAFTEGQTAQVKVFYRRGVAALDQAGPASPPNAINDDLRQEFTEMLQALDAPPPKLATPARKAPAPKKVDKL